MTQPWVDPSVDQVYAQIIATSDFLLQPNQSSASRVVVFDGFSGPLVLRDAQPELMESLDSCRVEDEPVVEIVDRYEPPDEVGLELGACALNADRTRVVGELAVTNDTDQDVVLSVAAEILDSPCDRLAVIGTFETPLMVEAATTETVELSGNAAYIDVDQVASCRIYYAEG